MEESKPKYKLGTAAIVSLIGLAILSDLISLIPFIGSFVGPFYWVCVSIYLWRAGCGLLNARKLATSAISTIAEVIPLIQALPLITVGISIVIIIIRAEDKTGMKLGTKQSRPQGHKPLYQDGRRMPEIERLTPQTESLNVDGVRAPNGGLHR